MSNNRFYLKTWFICIWFAFWWAYGIPLLVGIVLVIIKSKQEKRNLQAYANVQACLDTLQSRVAQLESPESLALLREEESRMQETVNILDSALADRQTLYDSITERAQKEALMNIDSILSEKNHRIAVLNTDITAKTEQINELHDELTKSSKE